MMFAYAQLISGLQLQTGVLYGVPFLVAAFLHLVRKFEPPEIRADIDYGPKGGMRAHKPPLAGAAFFMAVGGLIVVTYFATIIIQTYGVRQNTSNILQSFHQ